VIDLIADNNHVVFLKLAVGRNGPEVNLAPIGRNKATTFTGFCEEHDASLFRPLDTKHFDPDDAEQLFLLAYRAASHELHALMEGGARIQNAYLQRVKDGLDPANEPSAAGMMALDFMMNAYVMHEYREACFTAPLLAGDTSTLQHDVIHLEVQAPVLAVSALFSLRGLSRGDDLVRCALNVLPVSERKTVAVFSYGPEDAKLARPVFAPLFAAAGDHQKYELSKLIIDRIQNMILAPRHVATWSDRKKDVIASGFVETAMSDQLLQDDADLMLF
jgi:hypothetical protein